MLDRVQIALLKLEKVIENPEIQFGTSGQEVITQIFLADDDIKHVIDNYETTKVQFRDAVDKFETSQQSTDKQYKWNIISLIIEKLAQQRSDQAKKDAEAKEVHDDQEDETEVAESDIKDENTNVSENTNTDDAKVGDINNVENDDTDDVENDDTDDGTDDGEDDDDEASVLVSKKNQKIVDTMQKDFAYFKEIYDLIMRPDSITSNVALYMITAVGKGRMYLYRLRNFIRSIKAPPWVKIFFSWLQKLMKKSKLVNFFVRVFGTILTVTYYIFVLIVLPILRPRRTIMRIFRWFWGPIKDDGGSEGGGGDGDGGDGGDGGGNGSDTNNNRTVPVP